MPEAELVRRLASRLVCCEVRRERRRLRRETLVGDAARRCGGALVQRADDNEAVVLERLKVYQREHEPLVDYYRARPTFRAVNGAQAPDGWRRIWPSGRRARRGRRRGAVR